MSSFPRPGSSSLRANLSPGSTRRARRRRGLVHRPRFESLEQRIVLTVDYWTGAAANAGGNDNWSNTGNWSLNAVPGSSDTADFTSSESKDAAAIVDSAFAISSLVIDGTWNGTLTVSKAVAIAGNLTLASGTLNGDGTISAAGSGSQWTGGAISFGTGSLTNSGTLTITTTTTPNFHLNLAGMLANTGAIIVTGTDPVSASAAGTVINNQVGGTFDFQAGASLSSNSQAGANFNNAGTLERSTGTGTATISFPVTDSGTIQGNSGTLLLTGGGSGPGIINAGSGGTVILSGTYSGMFTGSGMGAVVLSDFTGANVTLDFSDSVLECTPTQIGRDLDGTITNAGNLTIATTTTPNNPLNLTGTLTNTGAIIVTGTNTIYANASGTTIENQVGGTFDFQAGATLDSNNQTSTTFNNAGTLERSTGSGTATIAFPVSESGTIQGNSGTLLLAAGGSGAGGSVNAGTGGTVILSGSYSGSFTGSGTGSVDLSDFTGTNATLDFSDSVLQWTPTQIGRNLGGTVTNTGNLTIATTTTPNNSLNLTGTLTSTGAIIVTGTNTIYANASDTTIENQVGGTFDFQAGATLSGNNQTAAAFVNGGTLERSTGSDTATISFPVTDSGSIQGNSGILMLTGGGNGAGGSVNAGAGGTVILGGDYSGSFTGSGTGSVDLSGFTGTDVTLDFSGSVLQWTSTQNGRSLGGTVINAGTLTIATTTTPNNGVNFTGTLTNSGTIIVTGTNTIAANATGATIVNEAGGTFNFESGATLSGNSQNATAFTNAGTLEVTAGAGSTATITLPVNDSGTIDGSSGTLLLTGGGSGGPGTINAELGGAVILVGTYSGMFTGSGAGAVILSDFTGAKATLDFSGSVLQWTRTQNGGNLAGTVTNTGALAIALTTIPNNSVTLYGTLTNAGTGSIVVTGTNNIFAEASGATINNQAGAIFELESSASLNNDGGTGAFNNAGILEMFGPGVTSTMNFGMNDTGLIEGESGTLQLTGGTGGGGAAIAAASGATVVLSGTYSGSFAGSGLGSVQLSNFSGGGSGVTLDFKGSVLQWTQGGPTLGGTITNAGTLTFAITNSAYLTGTLNNTGTIVDAATGGIYAGASGTTINNEAGATFEITVAITLSANGMTGVAFNNLGTLENSSGTGQSETSFPMSGSGSVSIGSGSLIVDSGTLEFDTAQALSVALNASLVLKGNLSGSTLNGDQFAPEGVVDLAGFGTSTSPQLLEAMSQDLGNVGTGFANNFAYRTLTLGNGTYVQLSDVSQNVSAAGSSADAVYVNDLVVPNGTTLDLHGLHLYARQTNIGGTIKGGTVQTLAAGGALVLDTAAGGLLSAHGQVDTWTFYGQPGQTVAVVVDTGTSGALSPPQPTLNYAQVQILDPSGHVVASGTNTQVGSDISLTGLALAASGMYQIQVQAPSAQSGATGNYLVTEWDASSHASGLVFNTAENGQLASAYATDQWTFSAAAGTSVALNLVNTSAPGIEFSLTGPNGFTAFSNASASTSAVVLPSGGSYVLSVHASALGSGSYAFQFDDEVIASLTPGTPVTAPLEGSEQSEIFALNVTKPGPVKIILTDPAAADDNELYASLGSIPMRGRFQALYSPTSGPNKELTIQAAVPGTYYILVYNDYAPNTGSFSLLATEASVFLNAVVPTEGGTSADTTLTLSGVGFDNTAAVSLVASDGTKYAATTTTFDLPTQVTARFDAGTVPAGVYSVKVTLASGAVATLPGVFAMVQDGEANLVTNLIVPNPLGRHIAATLYVEYSNTGTVAMPAPLLLLTATQDGLEGAFLTLNPALQTSGFWTSATPAGYSQSVQILASGATPGVLQPGESETVPVYYGGWLESQWDFSLTPLYFNLGAVTTSSTATVDWASMKSSLQPNGISTGAWDAIYANMTASLGSTWGAVITRLDQDAAYLGSLGDLVTDVSQLWQFEIQQANGITPVPILASGIDMIAPSVGPTLDIGRSFAPTIIGRNLVGPFGAGWQLAGGWGQTLSVEADGTVIVTAADGTLQIFQPDGRPGGGYFAQPGDHNVLASLGNNTYTITAPTGGVTELVNGDVAFEQDTAGNRITAGYSGGPLTSLTASSGQSITLGYNSAGRINLVTDSLGQSAHYTYDSSNQYLLSVSDSDGYTTTYTYSTGTGPQTQGALLSATNPDGTVETFTYNFHGWLSSLSLAGNALETQFQYGPIGSVMASDGTGDTTTYDFDAQGLLAKVIDPLDRETFYSYDSSGNLVTVTDAAGALYSYQYDSSGNLTAATNPLGEVTNFTYGVLDTLTSTTDAKGNTTQYQYDQNGDLVSTIYVDGTTEAEAFNLIGELIQSTDGDQNVVGYTYNASGQLTAKTYVGGNQTIYAYDALGNLSSVTDATGTTALSYDSSNRLTEVLYPDGTFLKYSYDSGGRRTQMVDQAGFTVSYAYNSSGELSGLTDGHGGSIVSYAYNADGLLSKQTNGNGTYTVYTYDADGEISSEINYAAGGSLNSSFAYIYNNLGERMTETTLQGQWSYTYDAVGELTHAVFASTNSSQVPNDDEQYFYDDAGNRTETIINGVVTTYTVNTRNEYTQVGSTGYSYDANGNLISQTGPGGTTSYAYNVINQLASVASSIAGSTSYQYDAFGNLYSVTQSSQETRDVTDPMVGSVVAQLSATGTPLAHYTYGLGLVSQVSAASGTSYYDFDALGSTVGLTNSLGTYVNTYVYTPFGSLLSSTGGLANPFQFVGRSGVVSAGNGLSIMGVRVYDAATGQFLSQDPLGLSGGDSNLRRYALNNPVSNIDPQGSESKSNDDGTDNLAELIIARYLRILTVLVKLFGPNTKYKISVEDLSLITLYTILRATQADLTNELKRDLSDDSSDQASNGGLFFGGATYLIGGIGPGLNPPAQSTASPQGPPGGLFPSPEPPPGDSVPPLDDFPPIAKAPAGSQTQVESQPVAKKDPNSLSGPSGYGTANYVALNQILPYTVNFENDPTATAPAQIVTITDQLDPNLNWSSLAFTAVGFGDTNILIPAGSQYFTTTVDMTENGKTFEVLIQLGIHLATGQIYASFESLDPKTQLPPDVLTGFLPPEDGTGRGTGYVTFTLEAKPNLATGTRISNVALVTFDPNAPIATNQVNDEDPTQGISLGKEATVTIDATPPTSAVAALPSVTPTTSFSLSWAGSDASGSGIATYNVYVSDDNGPSTLFKYDTTATSATFTGQFGHTYSFYSVATDNVGLVQATPANTQASTLLVGTPTSTVGPLPGITTTTSFTVSWTGSPGTGATNIATYELFSSDNGGPFTAFLTNTTLTSTTFNGVSGHSYGFYSVATDNLGNTQPTPTAAQATTTVAGVPTSTVSALPAVTTTTSFTVSWSGTPGPGATSISSYAIYDSDNGGPFTAFLSNTTLTSTTFNGQIGQTYGFYSVATDNLGNVQPTPSGEQATTTIDGPPSSTVAPLPAVITTASFTVSWSGTAGPGATSIISYDIFVSKDSGPFMPFLSNMSKASSQFTGVLGHTYSFYSVAIKNGLMAGSGQTLSGPAVFAIAKGGKSIVER
jgi:RHS repeat-associated protein